MATAYSTLHGSDLSQRQCEPLVYGEGLFYVTTHISRVNRNIIGNPRTFKKYVGERQKHRNQRHRLVRS